MDVALRCVPNPYDQNTVGNLLIRYQAQGFVVAPSVFERDSVDAYREQIEAALVPDANGRLMMPPDSPLSIAPTRAVRLRQLVTGALHHGHMPPHPSLFEVSWLIAPPAPPLDPHVGWHKDRDHEGMPGDDYHYPRDVHFGMYFADMTPEQGPTQILPRSHRDTAINPYEPGCEPVSFLCRKEDVVLWDQRTWHRGTSRTLPGGHRIFALFGFYALPVYGPRYRQRTMPAAQRDAWLNSEDPEERVFYGGLYAPEP